MAIRMILILSLKGEGQKKKWGNQLPLLKVHGEDIKNKAQEIQGAILPLVATHRNFAPFIGVILAGEFTEGAIAQLKSVGFHLLYFPYEIIVKGFNKFGIDASSEETTSEKEFQAKIKKWKSFEERDKLARYLLRLNKEQVKIFFSTLEKAVSRFITSISITVLHGEPHTVRNIENAIQFIRSYKSGNENLPVLKYEILIKYNNADKVEGTFKDSNSAVEFLSSFEGPKPKKK